MLHSRKDDHFARSRSEIHQDVESVVGPNVQDVVLHRGDGGLLGVDAVGDGIRQEAINNVFDAAIEGGREEHALSGFRRLTHESRYRRQETQFGHVVGLIEHGDLHQGEREGPLIEEVFESARTGNDDVNAVTKTGDLRSLVNATEDAHCLEVERLGQRGKRGLNLQGELSCWRQDQGSRRFRLTLGRRCSQSREHGKGEGERLARTGAATTEYIATTH